MLAEVLISLELRFVQGDKSESIFILLHVAISFDLHHLLKMLSFLWCAYLVSLSKSGVCSCVDLCLGLKFDSMCLFLGV